MDIFSLAGFAHEADTPDLAFERPEARADLDVKLGEQPFANSGFIDTGRDGDGVELPELMAFL